VWYVVATDKTRRLLIELRVVIDEVYEQMFAGFSPADLALLEGFLDRIAENIRA
jgi:DNA-binding MarR family transcriptional regulator